MDRMLRKIEKTREMLFALETFARSGNESEETIQGEFNAIADFLKDTGICYDCGAKTGDLHEKFCELAADSIKKK